MDFNEFLVRAQKKYLESIQKGWGWRRGQTYFVVLSRTRRDLSDKILLTSYDPYYQDQNIHAFLGWLVENW